LLESLCPIKHEPGQKNCWQKEWWQYERTDNSTFPFSGGLDSILATKLVASLGVRVVAVKFVTPFFDYELLADPEKYSQEMMEKYGIEVVLRDISHNYLDLLHNPSHGFGKNFNPCVDCKILMCSRAKELMKVIWGIFSDKWRSSWTAPHVPAS